MKKDKEKGLTSEEKVRPNEENLLDFENKTNNSHVPMKNWSRVIIETDEEQSKVLAIVTNNDFELADGLRVRLSPTPNDQPFGGKLS